MELRAPSDGKFDYRPVAPGTYRVLAFKNPQPNLPYRDAEAMKAFDAKGQVVRFSARPEDDRAAAGYFDQRVNQWRADSISARWMLLTLCLLCARTQIAAQTPAPSQALHRQRLQNRWNLVGIKTTAILWPAHASP